jgi:hypothetical protein
LTTEQKEQKQSSIPRNILRVIYAPHKAFKEIAEKPRLIGPIVIMILFVFASVGAEYTRTSRIYVQQTLPSSLSSSSFNVWTENAANWTSNANVTVTSQDHPLGSGLQSLQFNVTNATGIWMQLDNIGMADCLSSDGYKNLTFQMKWIHPNASLPQNLSLYLFSVNATDYFYRDLSETINQIQNNQWHNFTVPLGPNAEKWQNSSAQATWGDITGMRFEADWNESNRSDLTTGLSSIFFQSENFEQLTSGLGGNIATSSLNSIIEFVLDWMLFGVTLFVAIRAFKIQAELRKLLAIAGYSLIAFVFIQLLFIVFYALSPPLYATIYTLTPDYVVQNWILFYLFGIYLMPIWSIAICALGLRTAFNLSMAKGIILAVVGMLPYYALHLVG